MNKLNTINLNNLKHYNILPLLKRFPKLGAGKQSSET